MPLYICNTRQGTLDRETKAQISQDITDIHCRVTGAPPIFVHTAFFEESPLFPLEDKTLFVRGTIRKGRSDEQKNEIAEAIRLSLTTRGELPTDQVDAHIRETPASWVLEGGEIMPEPGEEDAWFAAQEKKHQEKHQAQEA